VELSKPSLDRGTGTLTLSAQLKNITKDTIEGPIKVRVLTLESELGVPEIANADNSERGTGAVWDFTSSVSGPLLSMGLSSPKTLTFRLADLRPLLAGTAMKSGVVNMSARVYGKLKKAKPDKEKEAGK